MSLLKGIFLTGACIALLIVVTGCKDHEVHREIQVEDVPVTEQEFIVE